MTHKLSPDVNLKKYVLVKNRQPMVMTCPFGVIQNLI